MEEKLKQAPPGYALLTEGKATVVYKEGEAFYNPIQQFNRDLSIMAIKQFIAMKKEEDGRKKRVSKKPVNPDGIDILEALAATGLRSVRYWKEIEGINTIVVNDLDLSAVESIQRNLEFNDIDQKRCIPNRSDCKAYMYSRAFEDGKRFDVIDLDPYGSASIFLDAAIQAVDNGGLLCVTCTDSAVLCGAHADQLWSTYQVAALKGRHCHEFGVRAILKELNGHAARYKRTIVPLLSLSIDFYFRVFVRVFDSPKGAQEAMTRIGMLYQCGACGSFCKQNIGQLSEKDKPFLTPQLPTDSRCQFCNARMKIGGPLWMAPIHSQEFLDSALAHLSTKESEEMYKTHKRMLGQISVCKEELPNAPLFYVLSDLCNILKLPCPPLLSFRSAIVAAGYKVSGTQCVSNGFKTDAPNDVIWDLLRCWHLQQNPPKDLSTLADHTPAFKILSVAPKVQADFTQRGEAKSASRNMARYIKNPGMGPKPRAVGKKRNIDEVEGNEEADVGEVEETEEGKENPSKKQKQ